MQSTELLKSDVGAQSAWKGFSSQTLYIAYRLVCDSDGYEYYPEDIEDLVIRKDGAVIEAIQIKNLSSDLTLSSLASTKTSKNNEGLFKRMCGLHAKNQSFGKITVAHFGPLGSELQELEAKKQSAIKAVTEKLVADHGLSQDEATWLTNSLTFQRVSLPVLEQVIQEQIKAYVPTMAAPNLAQELLVQYISKLSASKGCTTLDDWQEQIHGIGIGISAIDGFYKEYNKSLVRLDEFQLHGDLDRIEKEFLQGASAHPTHIRMGMDLVRQSWLERIRKALNNRGVALVKGVSGQGKSTLCYRYLIDNYPEGCVFCVRTISTKEQAENLVASLNGLGKYNKDLIIYIDVQPGEKLWAYLLQELQFRGMSIPVLISIRDEDYNGTPLNGKAIEYETIQLVLSEDEAHQIYDAFTSERPHETQRSFDDAWLSFGGQGPLIEFVYLLTNNQTLRGRLEKQVDALIQEKVSDEWLEILQLVCYAGRLGCAVDVEEVKKKIPCTTMLAAIRRLKDEYLVRVVDEGRKIEALHPVRAQIISDVLCSQIGYSDKEIVLKALSCVSTHNIWLLLLDYFSRHEYQIEDVQRLSQSGFKDWVSYADTIKAMLWLDCKRYVESNLDYVHSLAERYGTGWFCLIPMDLTGLLRPNVISIEIMKGQAFINDADIHKMTDEARRSLTGLSIDYEATDCFIKNGSYPQILPENDEERSKFGYALFWLAKRGVEIALPFNADEVATSVCAGELQPSADAIRGLFEHPQLYDCYRQSSERITQKLITAMSVISFSATEEVVSCKFIPPVFEDSTSEDGAKRDNQYWRIKMLNILQQIYPGKEYIDIELIGVNLLEDVGIMPLNDKLHIKKDNRPIGWATEINAWVRVRIEYTLRPGTWNQYVAQIDDVRRTLVDYADVTIKMIDDIYKKGRHTKTRGEHVDRQIRALKKKTLICCYLPTSAVDPYCLYSEGNEKDPVFGQFPMAQLLSVGKYERFRKQYNQVCSSMENFCNQFSEVLLVRIKKGDINTVRNPRLAIYNLYTASTALVGFQQEYHSLFSRYSSLDGSFSSKEIETVLTLLNVWRHVLDNPPRGLPIAYDAKQKYRKGTKYFRDTLERSASEVNGTLLETKNHAYIVANCEVSEESTLEDQYTRIVMGMRNAFQDAIPYSSNRWYVETQPVTIAFVPVISGISLSAAFSIPFYKLFDYEEIE